MPQSENHTPDRAELMQTIQRCAEAYRQVKAKLPKNTLSWSNDAQENQQKAFLAFAAHLPILCDLVSMQVYIACISHGASIGAIDPVDVGRFCHIAQTAMSAWKLANLTVPAARQKEEESARKRETAAQEKTTPLPSKGNQESALGNLDLDRALQQALNNLPSFEVQKRISNYLGAGAIFCPAIRSFATIPWPLSTSSASPSGF